MTQKLIQAFAMTMAILAGTTSAVAASKPEKIRIDSFPYVASLGESAAYVEQELADQATRICGSLENVSHLDEVTLTMTNVRAFKVNANGVPGAIGKDRIFEFAYPRVQGSAKVVCKN